MEDKKKDVTLKSPLVAAFNNIVNINRSKAQMKSTQSTYTEFLRFMTTEVKVIQAIKLPEEKKIKKLANINVAATFGTAGSLLSSLASGALDAAGLVGELFGGRKGKTPKGGKTGKPGAPSSPKAGKAIPKGKKIRLPGVRGLPLISAALAGLDFAQGISEGESVGKAGAGALGSAAGAAGGALAGTALAGVIGQALVPIPGLGFVLGAAVGSLGGFAGGYLADRAYESATGEGKVKEKQKAKLKQQEQQQKAKAAAAKVTFPEVLDKFDSVVTQFERNVSNLNLASGSESESEDVVEGFDAKSNEGGEPKVPDTPTQPYDGPISGDTFFPLPKGIVSNRSVGVKGGEYGAPRKYGGHSGQDIGGLPPGSPVVAWKTGKVRYTGSVEPGDTIITIDHGKGEQSVYKHVVPTVPPGTVVYGGQQIAKLFAAKAYPEHLHFEVWRNGSHTNPNGYISAAQKISSPLAVEKAKEQSEKSSVASGSSSPTVPTATAVSQTKPVSTATKTPPSADMIKKYEMAWQYRNNPFARGRIESAWEGMTPEQQQQAQEWAKTKGYDWNEMRLKEKQVSPQVSATVVPVPSMQQNVPQQIEQYPDYNLPQSSVTLMPIYIGGGSQPQQRPVVIAGGGGGGGGATIMPPVPTGQVLNSLFKTILLTNLSGT